jgi:hypothetical protein
MQNQLKDLMKIDIPLSCPACGGKMYSVGYDAPLKILKPRTWQVCKDCKFSRSVEDFKKSLCCA